MRSTVDRIRRTQSLEQHPGSLNATGLTTGNGSTLSNLPSVDLERDQGISTRRPPRGTKSAASTGTGLGLTTSLSGYRLTYLQKDHRSLAAPPVRSWTSRLDRPPPSRSQKFLSSSDYSQLFTSYSRKTKYFGLARVTPPFCSETVRARAL